MEHWLVLRLEALIGWHGSCNNRPHNEKKKKKIAKKKGLAMTNVLLLDKRGPRLSGGKVMNWAVLITIGVNLNETIVIASHQTGALEEFRHTFSWAGHPSGLSIILKLPQTLLILLLVSAFCWYSYFPRIETISEELFPWSASAPELARNWQSEKSASSSPLEKNLMLNEGF